MKLTREDAVKWWNNAKQRNAKRLAEMEELLQRRYEERMRQTTNYTLT